MPQRTQAPAKVFPVRTMALDYGARRIGVAVTDPTGTLAQPLVTLERARRGRDDRLDRLAELISELEVSQIVVGLPVHMSGAAGRQAELSRAFGESVESRTGIRVEYLDERWTSVEAERLLDDAGISAKKRRGRVDPIAAALLLRTWLARRAS